MLAQQTVDQVKQYHDIVNIISDYIKLTKKGRNYVGLCPFHGEKTPSFTVSPEKRIFHCFGCHESGDHITFVMKMDSLTFPEAIKAIAAKVGIEIIEEEFKGNYDREEREEIVDCIFHAREWFCDELKKSGKALEYLEKRAVSKDSIELFHLGFCPASFPNDGQINGRIFKEDLLVKAGIAKKMQTGELVPKFGNRLIFPIIDYLNRTVGFSARTLLENANKSVPKYINSEETGWFNKRKLLYGLHLAKTSIKKSEEAILVEGNMDVILAHQFGFNNVIASMGTALTPYQVQKIERFAKTIYLCMDNDQAGQMAMERSYGVLKEKNLIVRIMNLDDKDPADILVSSGTGPFEDAIEKAQTMFDFKLKRILPTKEKVDPDKGLAIIEALLPVIKLERESLIRNRLVRNLAERLDVNEEILLAKLKNSRYNIKDRLSFKLEKNRFLKAEESLIYLLATDLSVRGQISEEVHLDLFKDDKNKSLAKFLITNTKQQNELLETLVDVDLKSALVKILVSGEEDSQIKISEWKNLVQVLQSREKIEKIDFLKRQIAELENTEQYDAIPEKLQELQKLIHSK